MSVPDATDLHIYGGAALVGVGAGLSWGAGFGILAFGAALALIGLWVRSRVRR